MRQYYNQENTIALCRNSYESQYDFEEAVSQTIFMLLKNNYITVVKREEDLVVIEYDHHNPSFGGRFPYWLTENEALSVNYEDEEN